jgi:hypothetical protein
MSKSTGRKQVKSVKQALLSTELETQVMQTNAASRTKLEPTLYRAEFPI